MYSFSSLSLFARFVFLTKKFFRTYLAFPHVVAQCEVSVGCLSLRQVSTNLEFGSTPNKLPIQWIMTRGSRKSSHRFVHSKGECDRALTGLRSRRFSGECLPSTRRFAHTVTLTETHRPEAFESQETERSQACRFWAPVSANRFSTQPPIVGSMQRSKVQVNSFVLVCFKPRTTDSRGVAESHVLVTSQSFVLVEHLRKKTPKF